MEPFQGKVKKGRNSPIRIHSNLQRGKNITQSDLKKRLEERLSKSDITKPINIGKVKWKILPVCTDWSSFEAHFDSQVNQSGREIRQKEVDAARERFRNIFELKPKKIFRGLETFSDYFALLFDDTDKVVLESVNYGNAIYIVEGDWEKRSRETKSALKSRDNTKVIPHKRGWFSKLKNYLQIGFE